MVHFLQWAADPKIEKHKNLGVKALIFLCIFTVLFIVAKKRIWKDVA